jgi:hypothetical protein
MAVSWLIGSTIADVGVEPRRTLSRLECNWDLDHQRVLKSRYQPQVLKRPSSESGPAAVSMKLKGTLPRTRMRTSRIAVLRSGHLDMADGRHYCIVYRLNAVTPGLREQQREGYVYYCWRQSP